MLKYSKFLIVLACLHSQSNQKCFPHLKIQTFSYFAFNSFLKEFFVFEEKSEKIPAYKNVYQSNLEKLRKEKEMIE